MRKPRGNCYPSGPVPERGCYPQAPDRDGCYSSGPDSSGPAILRALLRVVTAEPERAPRRTPRSGRPTDFRPN